MQDTCAHCGKATDAANYVAHVPVCPDCMDGFQRELQEALDAMEDEYETEDEE